MGRAERTIEFLLCAWFKPAKDAKRTGESSADARRRRLATLEAVLEVMDGRITYRSRYLADLSAPLVLDLVVFDETNPRSVAYQFERLSHVVNALPRAPDAVGLAVPQRAVRRAVAELELAELTTLAAPENDAAPAIDDAAVEAELATLLHAQADHVSRISSAIQRTYLHLSRPPKRFEEGGIRLM